MPESMTKGQQLAQLQGHELRFIHLYHRGWDHHGQLKRDIVKSCGYVDQATAALVKDLE